MIDFILLIIGSLLGVWWCSVIPLPLIYGFPKTVSLSIKGILKKRSCFFYLIAPLVWLVILNAVSIILFFAWPAVVEAILGNSSFFIGQLIGICIFIIRLFTQKGRRDLSEDFWQNMIRYLNLKDPLVKEKFIFYFVQKFAPLYGIERAEEKATSLLAEVIGNKN